jgi:protein SCO1/2
MWRSPSFAIVLALCCSHGANAFDEKAALKDSQAAIGREPANYTFFDSENREVRLGDLRGKPLVVNFVYTGCIQVCPAATQFLASAVKAAERSLGPGTFRVATIGFNVPFDSPAAMKDFARKFGIGSRDWLFLTPQAATRDALLADFGFRAEATAAGFDHLLQVSIVDAQGRLYRQVYGDEFAAPLFVGPLVELVKHAPVEQRTLGAAWDKLKILCTVYDPSAGRYRVSYAVLIEILVGASVMLGGSAFLLLEWRRRARPRARPG